MAKTYRVGIIGRTGKGDYGHGVDVAIAKVPNVEIVALADENEAGRTAAAKRTNPKTTYASYREMLDKEKLDLVAICPRWVDQHHDMIVAAAEHGCHVYMEKPFCPTLAECDDAMRQLEMRHLKLAIAHISQWSPVLDVVKSLIHSGEIGDVLELRGRGKEDATRGGGEDLWVLGSHIFGLMRAVAGNATSCFATVLQKKHKVTKADVVEGNEGIGSLAGDSLDAIFVRRRCHRLLWFASRSGGESDAVRSANLRQQGDHRNRKRLRREDTHPQGQQLVSRSHGAKVAAGHVGRHRQARAAQRPDLRSGPHCGDHRPHRLHRKGSAAEMLGGRFAGDRRDDRRRV